MPFSQEDLEELAALGVRPCPPDHWVYQQGTTFVIPDQDAELDAETEAPPPGR